MLITEFQSASQYQLTHLSCKISKKKKKKNDRKTKKKWWIRDYPSIAFVLSERLRTIVGEKEDLLVEDAQGR